MQPFKVLDPRAPLDRVNRDQMREFAERNGITEITWDMTGDEMRYLLKKRGISDIGAPFQILGTRSTMEVRADNDPTVPTINLEDLQRQQWEQRAKEREQARKEADKGSERGPQTRAELAKECKKRGIKMQRTDTKEKLIERLNGKSHAA